MAGTDDVEVNTGDPDLALLIGDVDKVESPEKKVAVTDDEEEVKPVVPVEEEEEEEKDEVEASLPFDRPSIREIKAKYPEFFKEFPSLREAFFREQEYMKVFPTVDDAKEAFEDSEALVALRESALSGDPAATLDAVASADGKAFEAFAINFLPALYKKSPDVYTAAVHPLLESLVRRVYADGKRNNNENLQNSALHMSLYLFETADVATGDKTISKTAPELKRDDRQAAAGFQRAYDVVVSNVTKSMRTLILRDLDPQGALNKFMRDKIVGEVTDRVGKQLELDAGHNNVMASRWKRAKQNGYSDDETSKIVTAYLARAKSLIPSLREEVRKVALGVKAKTTERRVESNTARENNGGRPVTSTKAMPSKAELRKMTDLEILSM